MTQPVLIRDAVYDRLSVVFRDTFKTIRKVPLPTLQETDLPGLSVFILVEDGSPDGDANVGDIRFVNDVGIGISVVRAFADPIYLDGGLDADADLIKSTLLTDTTFTNMGPAALFEGVTKMRRSWVFQSEGEAYSAELRLEMTFRYREDFAPVITDTLEVIHVKTAFPVGGTDHDKAGEQQVEAEYDLPTT